MNQPGHKDKPISIDVRDVPSRPAARSSQAGQRVRSFNNWRTTNLHSDVDYFFQKLRELDIGMTIDGEFVDLTSGCKVRRNQVHCMIRRPYLEEGRTLNGKNLNLAIEKFFEALPMIMKDPKLENEWTENRKEFTYLDKYI